MTKIYPKKKIRACRSKRETQTKRIRKLEKNVGKPQGEENIKQRGWELRNVGQIQSKESFSKALHGKHVRKTTMCATVSYFLGFTWEKALSPPPNICCGNPFHV